MRAIVPSVVVVVLLVDATRVVEVEVEVLVVGMNAHGASSRVWQPASLFRQHSRYLSGSESGSRISGSLSVSEQCDFREPQDAFRQPRRQILVACWLRWHVSRHFS